MKANSYTSYLSYKTLRYLHSGMRLSFGKNSGKFYVAIDSNPNNTVVSSYLR